MSDTGATGTDTVVRVEHNLAYLETERMERLDLYRPYPQSGLLPGLVVLHGGGWISGDKADAREQTIATELTGAGYVCASINYRLAAPGRSAWPDCLYDSKNAVRFLRRHAGEYGIDQARIGVIGCSAGAHLAAMVALTAEMANLEPGAPYPDMSSRVSAAVLLYGVYHFETWQPVETDGTPKAFLRAVPRYLFGGSMAEVPDRWREAAPVHQAHPDAPPLLLIHGLDDVAVPPDQTTELASALAAVGAPHEVHFQPDAGHSFDFHPPGADLAPRVIRFFDTHLKHAIA